jgi:hypothetical protein
MPSGGRRSTTWKKGEKPPKRSPGRPKGSKDVVPRTFKGTIKRIFEDVATENPEVIHAAILKGLKAPAPKSFAYLQLMTVTIDGREAQAVPLDQIREFLRRMTSLFLEIVPDVEQRRQFALGLRRLTGVVGTAIIDAESTPEN